MLGFFDDRGNQFFGQENPIIKSIKQSAANGKQRGIDKLPNDLKFSRFPAKLTDPVSLDGSLGDWRSQTPNQFLPYPGIESKTGFTEPLYAGDEIERIGFDNTKLNKENDTKNLIKKRREGYRKIYKDPSIEKFTHLLDYFQGGEERVVPNGEWRDQEGKTFTTQPNTGNIYLGSFIRTLDDNEDPTILGYDIEIDTLNSPLFASNKNGQGTSCQSFIDTYGKYNTEIKSRGEVLLEFKRQLFKFLKNNTSESENSSDVSSVELTGDNIRQGRNQFQTRTAEVTFSQPTPKTYYLKKISGLDSLNEQNTSEKTNSFVDYGKDFISLSFNEDVSQNIGYLGSLYKNLTWSRINGKQIIPENLLRFDVIITISEIRRYNRVFKNLSSNNLEIYADLISKYQYTLYECQFFFDKLPHGNELDMSSPKQIDEYEIKFNFKFSTLKFSKFKNSGSSALKEVEEQTLDNKFKNIKEVDRKSTTNNFINSGAIVNLPPTNRLSNINSSDDGGVLGIVKKSESTSERFKKSTETLKRDLTSAFIREGNRQILSQAALLNRTLERIRNAIPGAGRMSEPTNVYGPNAQNLFFNDAVLFSQNLNL